LLPIVIESNSGWRFNHKHTFNRAGVFAIYDWLNATGFSINTALIKNSFVLSLAYNIKLKLACLSICQ